MMVPMAYCWCSHVDTCARTALSGTHNKAENRAELVPYLNWTAGMCANRKRNGARSSATFFGSNDEF